MAGVDRSPGARVPSPEERAAAEQLRRVLVGGRGGREQRVIVVADSGRRADVVLTPGLSAVLVELLGYLGGGEAVAVVPVGRMLTTQQAADLLEVSRPFLIALLDRGEIPHVLVGRHRRIRAEALLSYKRRRDIVRADALGELAGVDGGRR